MSITIKDLCGLSAENRDVIAQVNARTVRGQISVKDKSGALQEFENLLWVSYAAVEDIVVNSDKRVKGVAAERMACFKEKLVNLRSKDFVEFWNLWHAAVILNAYGMIDPEKVTIFSEVDNEYIEKGIKGIL